MHCSKCISLQGKINNWKNIYGNKFNFATRGFSWMLNKNIISPKVYEVVGALGDPGWIFSWSFMFISFRIGPKSLLKGFRGY